MELHMELGLPSSLDGETSAILLARARETLSVLNYEQPIRVTETVDDSLTMVHGRLSRPLQYKEMGDRLADDLFAPLSQAHTMLRIVDPRHGDFVRGRPPHDH